MQEHRPQRPPLAADRSADALSAPLVVMYVYQVIDTVTTTPPGSIIPDGFTLPSTGAS
jgi:hypothetical protein